MGQDLYVLFIITANYRRQDGLLKIHRAEPGGATGRTDRAFGEPLQIPQVRENPAAFQAQTISQRVFECGEARRRKFASLGQRIKRAVSRSRRDQDGHTGAASESEIE
jgi:hypothetical protein